MILVTTWTQIRTFGSRFVPDLGLPRMPLITLIDSNGDGCERKGHNTFPIVNNFPNGHFYEALMYVGRLYNALRSSHEV